MTNQAQTPAELVAAWRPVTSPREAALAAIMRAEGVDRITAAIIQDAREAAAARA